MNDEGHVCEVEVGDLRLLPEVGKVSALVDCSPFPHVLARSEQDSWAALSRYQLAMPDSLPPYFLWVAPWVCWAARGSCCR